MADTTDLASTLPEEQKAQLHEVANLMTQIYETLAAMRFVDPAGIIRGPHDLTATMSEYKKHNLDPAIIYLYSILPYIDEHEANAHDFFHGSSFADFRKVHDVERGRDPLYASPTGGFADEDGEYMFPWYTPLSLMGNHQSVILYDAKRHRIWIVDQEFHGTTDLALSRWYRSESDAASVSNKDEDDDDDDQDDEDDGDYVDDDNDHDDEDSSDESGEDDDSEYWSDDAASAGSPGDVADLQAEAEEAAAELEYEMIEDAEEDESSENGEASVGCNRNRIEHIPSRDAGDVLRDMIRWYRELKVVPGGEHSGNGWDPDIIKPIYKKHGWPDNFDADSFEIDQARGYCADRGKYNAEEPLRKADCYTSWKEYSERDIQRCTQAVADATSVDAEWLAKYNLRESNLRHERNERDLKEAKAVAEKMCPGGKCQKDEDLPLWEFEQLRVEWQWKREAMNRGIDAPEKFKDDPAALKRHLADVRHKTRDEAIYAKAFEASKADAERLCPGRTFEQATGIKSVGRQDTLERIQQLEKLIVSSVQTMQALKDWAAELPEGTPAARKAVEREIENNEGGMRRLSNDLKSARTWLAEHGNTD